MTAEEIREILARELWVSTDCYSFAAYDQRVSRRAWYAPEFSAEGHEDWRAAADALMASLAQSGLAVVAVPEKAAA